MKRWLLGLCGVALGLLVLPEAGEADDQKDYNIVLITADTLRGDMTGPGGSAEVYTPHLDRIAAEGVRFTRAYTTITTTLPAHASLMSSLYPKDHRAYSNVSKLSNRIVTLAEVLGPLGWRTGAHINMPWLNPDTGNVSQGFQDIRRGDHIRKADKTNPWAENWIRKQSERDGPFLLWLHYVDNHTPYHAPGPYSDMYFEGGKGAPGETSLASIWDTFPPDHRESEAFLSWLDGVNSADFVVGTYKGSVTWLDQHIALLRRSLEESGQWDETIFVFTADHGESLGEHDLWFVHAGLYEPTVRVPLVMRFPEGPRGRKVDTVVSLVDVMPTLLGRIGAPTPQEARGRDLWPLIEGADLEGAALLEHTGQQLQGVVTQRWKYIEHRKTNRIYASYPMNEGTQELYDLVEDPGELKDLSGSMPDKVVELQGLMARLEEGERSFEEGKAEVSDEMQRQLEALGYFGH